MNDGRLPQGRERRGTCPKANSLCISLPDSYAVCSSCIKAVYDSSIIAACFASTLLEVICQHYGTLMFLVAKLVSLKVNSKEARKSVLPRKEMESNFHLCIKLFCILKATPRGTQVIYKPNQMCSKGVVCVF